MTERNGQCLCGAVNFKAAPSSNNVGVCHCELCRKSSAGPFFAVDCGDTLVFEDESNVGVYESSEGGDRGFCKQCGATLFWRAKDRSKNIVAVDLFEGLEGLQLDREVYIDEKPNYYAFTQKTKQLTGSEVKALFAAAAKKY